MLFNLNATNYIFFVELLVGGLIQIICIIFYFLI